MYYRNYNEQVAEDRMNRRPVIFCEPQKLPVDPERDSSRWNDIENEPWKSDKDEWECQQEADETSHVEFSCLRHITFLSFLVLPNNEYLWLSGLFNNSSINGVWGMIILIHPVSKISLYVCQGQDKFAFGEALTDSVL